MTISNNSIHIENQKNINELPIEQLLRNKIIGNSGIYDLAIVQKKSLGVQTDEITIIFVVSTNKVEYERLEKIITTFLNSFKIVQLTAIPLDENGNPDRKKLDSIPVFDRKRMENITERLLSADPSFSIDIQLVEPKVLSKQNNHQKIATLFNGTLGEIDEDETLLTYLEQAAENFPSHSITFIDTSGKELQISYPDFKNHIQKIGSVLYKQYQLKQTPYLIQLESQHKFLSAVWGGIWAGGIPVPLACPRKYNEQDAIAKKLITTLSVLKECKVITNSERVAELRQFLDDNHMNTIEIIEYETLFVDLELIAPVKSKSTDTAVFLMTSGSTAAPKLVPQSHAHIIARSKGTIFTNNFTATDISLNWLPLDHVGGLVMFHVRDIVIGCNQYQVDTNYILQDPIRWMKMCDQYRVNLTWAPNFAFNLINSFESKIKELKLNLSSLRFIMNAGESVIASQANKFLKLFEPHHLSRNCMVPAWGMSETCSAVLFNTTYLPENPHKNQRFVSVGKPIPGIEIKIVDENDEILKTGQQGRLLVKGESVLEGYYNDDEANRVAFNNEGWFDTGDLAVIDNDEVAIVGRDKDIIIINGHNLSSHEIEEFIDKIDGVEKSHTAVVPVRNSDDSSDSVAIFIHTLLNADFRTNLIKKIRSQVTLSFGVSPQFILCVDPDQIPKTTIGKIQKGKLKQLLMENKFKPDYVANNFELKPDLSQDIFERIYIPKNIPEANISPTVLLFVGEKEIIDVDYLHMNTNLIVVREGIDFIKNSPTDYIMSFKDKQFEALFDSIINDHLKPTSIIYSLETKKISKIEDLGEKTISILELLKAVQKIESTIESFLLVNKKPQASDSSIEATLSASAYGLLRSAADEIVSIHFKVIETDNKLAGELVNEVADLSKFDFEVSYSENRRYISKLAQVTPKYNEVKILPGCYVITGGLGEISEKLAIELMTKKQVSLILLGRERKELLSDEKKERLKNLEQMGSVKYIQTSLTDLEGLIDVLRKESIDQAIEGIFHLAAHLKQVSISDVSHSGFLADTEPKVFGTYSIYEVAKQLNIPLIINFSSLNGFFGGAGISAYSSANRFQEAFSNWSQMQKEGPFVLNISWTMWEDIGLSKQFLFKELTQRKGFEILSIDKSFTIFWNILRGGHSNSFVGIDYKNQLMWPYLAVETNLVDELILSQPLKDDMEIIVDDFNREIPYKINSFTDKMVVNPNSASNKTLVLDGNTKTIIANVFSEVLKINSEALSYDESLFDLGGHSLILPQIQSKIVDQTGVDFSVIDLFQYSSVNALSGFIDEKKLNNESNLSDIIASIFCEVLKLNISELDFDESLFDLGGHSLLLPQIHSRIVEQTNSDISLIDLFQFSSVNDIVSFIESNNKEDANVIDVVAAVFSETLKIEASQLNYSESLFDLGGHSLILPQIHSKIVEVTQIDFSLIDLFQYSSVQELADYLENKVTS